MKIVKLDAIDSTNSYLENLIRQSPVENGTVIVAEYQTNGKGQFDNKWISDKGKNLTFSVLAKFRKLKVEHQFYLNYSVSLALYNVLKYYIPEKLTVKWPNDILSANHKICGILIKNSINKDTVNYAVIGIGLNVNQVDFPPDLINVTSLKNILNRSIDKDVLLDKIILEIQYQLVLIQQQKFKEIAFQYEKVLYKKGIPSMFIDANDKSFLGIIKGVSHQGKLQIEMDDESIQEFSLKEIKLKNIS